MDRLFFELNRRDYVDKQTYNNRNITRREDALPFVTKNPQLEALTVLQKQRDYNGQRGTLKLTKDTSITTYNNDPYEEGRDNRLWESVQRPFDVSGYIFDKKYIKPLPVSKSSRTLIEGVY